MMPINPANTRSLLDTFVRVRGLFRKRVAREPPAGDAQRPQRLAREGFVGLEDACSPLVGERPAIFADEFARASRQQHVRRALGKHDAAVLLLGVTVHACSSTSALTRMAPRPRAEVARRARRSSIQLSARRPAARPRSGHLGRSIARQALERWRCWRGRRRPARVRVRRGAHPSMAPPPSACDGARRARNRIPRSSRVRWR